MHLKRYQMPAFWGLSVKKEKFVISPRGSHPKQFSIPLQVVLRDILGLAQTRREVRSILRDGKILIDKKPRTEGKFSLGLMDILEIPAIHKSYRVEVGRKGLLLQETTSSDQKICRIKGKAIVRGGKEQLNLHDGRNIFVGKKSPYKVGDSLLISLPGQEILSHLPLKKGSDVLIIKGKNIGVRGRITSLSERKYMMEKATATLDVEGRMIETLRNYVFVIAGREKKEKSPEKRQAPKKEKSKEEIKK